MKAMTDAFRNVRIGYLAKTLILRQIDVAPGRVQASLGQLDALARGGLVGLRVILDSSAGPAKIIGSQTDGIHLFGILEAFPGLTITEEAVHFSHDLPQTLLTRVSDGAYSGGRLSSIITGTLRGHDPVLGKPTESTERFLPGLMLPFPAAFEPWPGTRDLLEARLQARQDMPAP